MGVEGYEVGEEVRTRETDEGSLRKKPKIQTLDIDQNPFPRVDCGTCLE